MRYGKTLDTFDDVLLELKSLKSYFRADKDSEFQKLLNNLRLLKNQYIRTREECLTLDECVSLEQGCDGGVILDFEVKDDE